MKNVVLVLVFFTGVVPVGRAATGDVVSKLAAPDSHPTGLAFDGTHLWMADRKSDKLYRIDTKSGKVSVQLQAPGFFPTGMTWDGSHLWVADLDFTDTSTEDHTGKIYKLCSKTGRIVKMIEAPYADPQGLAWDGKYLWMSDHVQKKIICLSPEDGTTIVEFPSPASDPQGLAWDGQYLWVADRIDDEIYRVHPKSGVVVMILPSPGPYPWGLAWAKGELWNVDYQTDQIYQIKVFDSVPFSRTNRRSAVVSFNHEAMNLGPGTVEKLNVYIAEPRSRDNQEIRKVSYSSKPAAFVYDRWGQKIAHFQATNLAPQSIHHSVMTVRADLYEVRYHIFPEKVGTLEDIPRSIRKQYLRDGSKYWIHDPLIQSETKLAVGDGKNPYWIARNIFQYLGKKLQYVRVGGWNIAPTVLNRGSGSCSEYTFLFIAMCRAAGLPARYVGALVVRGDDASMDYVFHRWPEVYLPGYGWVPADAQAGDKQSPRDQAMAFGFRDNKFLITTVGGGDSRYLGWSYNSSETWTADGPVRLRMETIGDWEPIASANKKGDKGRN